jgi:hypothetical protein
MQEAYQLGFNIGCGIIGCVLALFSFVIPIVSLGYLIGKVIRRLEKLSHEN